MAWWIAVSTHFIVSESVVLDELLRELKWRGPPDVKSSPSSAFHTHIARSTGD